MSSSIRDNSTSTSSDTITKIDPSVQKTIDTIRDAFFWLRAELLPARAELQT